MSREKIAAIIIGGVIAVLYIFIRDLLALTGLGFYPLPVLLHVAIVIASLLTIAGEIIYGEVPFVAIFLYGVAGVISFLNYHTPPQIICGIAGLIGVIIGAGDAVLGVLSGVICPFSVLALLGSILSSPASNRAAAPGLAIASSLAVLSILSILG